MALACLPLALAVSAALALAVPGWGLYAAMGLGLFSAATGLGAYRRRQDAAGRRLAGAGAAAVGLLALALAATKYGLTLAAIGALERAL